MNWKFLFESRIGSYNLHWNLESNLGVVVCMFNADCHRSCVGLLCTTGNYPTVCYVIIIITDKQRCADSAGSLNNIA